MTEQVEIAIIATDAASDILDKIGSKFGALGQLGVAAVTAVTGAFAGLVAAGSEAQDVQAMFDATISKSPMSKYKDDLLKLADAYSKTTRFEDENIIAAETVLARYSNLGDKIKDMVPLTLDFATLMKEDATSAAQELGKALEDISGGSLGLLARTRLLSKEEKEAAEAMAKAGKTADAQAYIIDILTKKTGGLAEKMGQTFKGRMEIFKNSMQNITEEMGMKLLPILEPLLTRLTELAEKVMPVLADVVGTYVVPALQHAVDWLLRLKPATENATAFIGDLWKSLTGGLLNAVKNMDWKELSRSFADWIKNVDWNQLTLDLIAGIRNLIEALDYVLANVDWLAVFGAIGEAFLQVVAGIAGYKWDDVADMAAGLVNVMNTTAALLVNIVKNKFEEIKSYISGFFPNLLAMWEANWNLFLEILGKIWDAIIAAVVQKIADVANAIIDGLKNAWNRAMNFVGEFVEVGKNIITALIDGVVREGSAFIEAIIDLVVTAVEQLLSLSWLSGLVPGSTPTTPPTGTGSSTDHVAGGGNVYAGSSYIVGEKGPELFVPGGNGTIIPNNQLQMNYIYGPVSLVISGGDAQDLLGLRI